MKSCWNFSPLIVSSGCTLTCTNIWVYFKIINEVKNVLIYYDVFLYFGFKDFHHGYEQKLCSDH